MKNSNKYTRSAILGAALAAVPLSTVATNRLSHSVSANAYINRGPGPVVIKATTLNHSCSFAAEAGGCGIRGSMPA